MKVMVVRFRLWTEGVIFQKKTGTYSLDCRTTCRHVDSYSYSIFFNADIALKLFAGTEHLKNTCIIIIIIINEPEVSEIFRWERSEKTLGLFVIAKA